MIANLTQFKCLRWYIVLAALTCASANPSTVDPKTIFAGSAAPKHPLGVVGQNDARAKRYLRTTSDTTKNVDDENEERGWKEGFKNLIGQKLVNTQDATTLHFKKLMGNLDMSMTDSLNWGKLQKWHKFVKERHINPVRIMVETLIIRCNEKQLINTIAAGKNDEKTRDLASKLEDHLLRKWATDVHHAGDVIDLLKSDDNMISVLKNPLLQVWIKNIIKNTESGHIVMDTTHPNKEDNAIPTIQDIEDFSYELLLQPFLKSYGQNELAKLLFEVQQDEISQDIAIKLVQAQLRSWKKEGLSLKSSFRLLKLDQEDPYSLMNNPMLRTWFSYGEMLGLDPYQMLLVDMRTKVGDQKVDMVLYETTYHKNNDGLLLKLQKMQEQHYTFQKQYPQAKWWQTEGKSGDDVFDLLKLRDKGKGMFETKEWSLWVAYLTFLEDQKLWQDRKDVAEVIYSVLKSRFSSDNLIKLFDVAKDVESTKDFAYEWMRREWILAKRTPDEAFLLLKLDKMGDSVFASPEFDCWVKYFLNLNKRRKKSAITELVRQVYRHFGPKTRTMLDKSESAAIEENDTRAIDVISDVRKCFRMTLKEDQW